MVRQATKNKGNSSGKNQRTPRPSPVLNILKIGSLNRYHDKDYSLDLLHQVAKLCAPLIHERGFKVGTLCEMFPKNANLLGLNVNKGLKILLRLRHHHNERLFLPLGDIIGTFLHELTHNLYGPHDAKFYQYLDGLKERYEALQYGGRISGYVCEEEKLGGGAPRSGYFVSEKEKRIQAVSKIKYIGESKKLGTVDGGVTKTKPIRDAKLLRMLMLEAAERRAKDSKWCIGETEGEDLNDEEDVVYVGEGGDANKENIAEEEKGKVSPEYREIVDLTIPDGEEIIVIDGCEDEAESSALKSILSTSKNKTNKIRQVSFGLLPSLDDNQFEIKCEAAPKEQEDKLPTYFVSNSSPRTFINDQEKYPRRKLVADIGFNRIMKYSPKKKYKVERERNVEPKIVPPIVETVVITEVKNEIYKLQAALILAKKKVVKKESLEKKAKVVSRSRSKSPQPRDKVKGTQKPKPTPKPKATAKKSPTTSLKANPKTKALPKNKLPPQLKTLPKVRKSGNRKSGDYDTTSSGASQARPKKLVRSISFSELV